MRKWNLSILYVLALLLSFGISLEAQEESPISKARMNAQSKLSDWIYLTSTTITSSLSTGVSWETIEEKYGISALSDLNSATLGEPYPICRLTCEEVFNYQPGDDLLSRLEIIRYEFPILINGKVCGIASATQENTTGFALGSPVVLIRQQYRDTYQTDEGYEYAQINFHNKLFFVIRSGPDGLYITGAVERDLGFLFGEDYQKGTYPFMPLDEAMPKIRERADYFTRMK